jgi:hypothetical protein
MSVRVTCINKDAGNHENPYTAISNLGWVNDSSGETGKSTRLQMYDFVNGGGEAYVQVGAARAVLITAVTPGGTKYVKTQADSTTRDNLLKLPEC